MTGPLAGVRVVEVASHVFVPMAGAVLNEWGADVIKIEHPETGDPYRGLVTAGIGRTGDRPTRGPEHGEHSEAVLLELDLSWDDIGALKQRGVIL